MKKAKNKIRANRFYFFKLLLQNFSAGAWRWPAMGFLLFCIFFCCNNCEAQNVQAISMSGTKNPKLSGIYSSKNNNSIARTAQSAGLNQINSTTILPADFPINYQLYKEEIGKRTYTSRTFEDGRGGLVIQYGSKNLNYLDSENKLQPIKPWLHSSPNGWSATQQEFPTHLYRDGSTAISSETTLGGATRDRKSTRLNSSHSDRSRMPSSA